MGGRDDVEQAREDVYEAMERVATLCGLSRSCGRLYGVSLFAEDSLSLDELADRAGYAKSTASTATTELERLGLLHRRSVPGESRRVFYEAETDHWRVLQGVLRRRVSREVAVTIRTLESAESTLAVADGERARRDLDTVRSLKSTCKRVETVVDLLASDSVDRLGSLTDRLRG